MLWLYKYCKCELKGLTDLANGHTMSIFYIIMVLKKALVLKIINDHSSQQIYKQDQD